MCEEQTPEDRDEDGPEIEEVVSEFDQRIRVRSGFQIEEQEPGVLGINLFGPILEFDDDLEDLELEDEDEQE